MIAASALSEAIHAQPESLARMLTIELSGPAEQLAGARTVWLVGTGTSQHAAELGAIMLADAGRDARWCSSATFVRFGPPLGAQDAVIVISHTAESAFARAARARAQAEGVTVISITGTGRGWPEAIETVERERSETYTASYTAALAVLARLSHDLGSRTIDGGALESLPERARAALRRAEDDELTLPERVLVVAGAGPAGITAREGALKLREAARVLSEGYEAEYLLHGVAVPLDERDALLLLSPDTDPDGLVSELGATAARAGLRVGWISEPDELPAALAQIPLTIRLQALAARAAEQRGHDPDTVIVGPWTDPRLWDRGQPA